VLERLMARWLASPVHPANPVLRPADPMPPPADPMPPPADNATGPPAAVTATPLEDMLLQTARRALAVALEPDAMALHRLLIAESGRFPELAEMVRQSGAATGMARIAGLLAAEMMAGRLAPLDPGFAAEQFLHMVLTGPQRRALGLAPPLDQAGIEAWARDAVALFLNGCRSRPPPA